MYLPQFASRQGNAPKSTSTSHRLHPFTGMARAPTQLGEQRAGAVPGVTSPLLILSPRLVDGSAVGSSGGAVDSRTKKKAPRRSDRQLAVGSAKR